MYHDLLSKKGLTLDRLQTLVRVADSESLIEAANRDPVLQSQFSRQLRELENFFGCALTERQNNKLMMSTAGRELAALSRSYLQGLDCFRLAQMQREVPVRIGAGDRIIHWYFSKIPAYSSAANRHYAFCVDHLATTAIRARLLDHHLDMGVLDASNSLPQPLKERHIGCMRYGLFIPEAFRLDRKRKGLWRASGWPMAGLHDRSRQQIQNELLTSLFADPPRVKWTCQSLPAVAQLVKQGHAAAFLPIQAANDFERGSVRHVALSPDAPIHENLSLAWNPRMIELTPGIEPVIKFIGDHLTHQLAASEESG